MVRFHLNIKTQAFFQYDLQYKKAKTFLLKIFYHNLKIMKFHENCLHSHGDHAEMKCL